MQQHGVHGWDLDLYCRGQEGSAQSWQHSRHKLVANGEEIKSLWCTCSVVLLCFQSMQPSASVAGHWAQQSHLGLVMFCLQTQQAGTGLRRMEHLAKYYQFSGHHQQHLHVEPRLLDVWSRPPPTPTPHPPTPGALVQCRDMWWRNHGCRHCLLSGAARCGCHSD